MPRRRASIDPLCRVENWDDHSVFSRAVPLLKTLPRPLEKVEFAPRVLAEDIVLWCILRDGSVLVDVGPREEQEDERCGAQEH